MDVRTQRSVGVDADPTAVWSAVQRVEDYRSWWPWLREFDGRVLAPGERWRCTIRPPLPWSLRVEVHLVDVRDGRVEAVVSGDVAGAASLSVAAGPGGGTRICLDAALDAAGGATAMFHRVAPRTSRWAHDRVVDAALEGFRRRAI